MPRFEPRMQDQEEAKLLDSFRWWKVHDLRNCPERLTPLSLASIVERYLLDGPPREVPDVEIAID